MPSSPAKAFDTLLRDVSRSFYLTMRALPGRVRPQIGVAYLLARATDTIADTEVIPVADRLETLERLRQSILGHSDFDPDFTRVTAAPSASTSQAERILLNRMRELLDILNSFTPEDQRRIRRVLDTITSGQALDLDRFASANAATIVALKTDAELDDYTYRVAGCVGEFWTRICRAHLFPSSHLDESTLINQGIRFGKGLQLVNILRDIATDLRNGRCYLPESRLDDAGLNPVDLLNPQTEPRFRGVYLWHLDLSNSHLSAGWEYTLRLPFRLVRLRLACSWPLLIAAATVRKLKLNNVLDDKSRIKISRREVRSIMLRSVLWYPLPKLWNRLFAPG